MVSSSACVPVKDARCSPPAAARDASGSVSDALGPEPSVAAARGSEGLAPEHRLRRRVDYQRCYQRGRRLHGSLLTLHFAPNQLSHPRLGITASRKVGGAVVRQRLKRRVREIYRRWSERGRLPGVDVVVHLKPTSAAGRFADVSTDLTTALTRLLPGSRAER